jgi:hypothetical protein
MRKFGTFLFVVLGILWTGLASGQVINVSTGSLAFGNVAIATTSGEQTFTVDGNGIPTGQLITVTAPAGYAVSLTSGSGFGTAVETATEDGGGNIPTTTIYVHTSPRQQFRHIRGISLVQVRLLLLQMLP